jgi:ribosomal protein L37AE/L43A
MGANPKIQTGTCHECGERGFVYRWGSWWVCQVCAKKLAAANKADKRPLN